MDMDEARTILTNNRLTDVGSPLQLAVAAVFARLAEMEAGEVTTEYAVRWPEGPFAEIEVHGTQESAARVVAKYRDDGPELVSREVRRGPWTVAS